MKASIITAVASLAVSSSALGINCRGSGFCPSDNASGNLINLKVLVDSIQPRDRSYGTGQQLACTGSICAFYQNTGSGTAGQASDLLQQLLDHGCKKCGSAPTNPGNDVSKGQLTVNVVSNPSCQGVC
ncbi:KP4 killer toxin [Cladobotryum mycophilum]|uniref:KP4 killer toxin n=1 Tax=Cladobotryum mycophilum TaxID=491253 RepID=A0ABR0SFA6_9HYPO